MCHLILLRLHLNIDPTTANVPLVNGTAAAGNSTSYSRGDHIHPQQLTFDNDITATKFIKSGGLASEILCANGDTTTLDNKLSRTYNGSGGGWIRLCVFPAGASVGNPFIEFKVYSSYNAVQTIRLVPYYTVNGINTVYGIFTAPTKVSSYYDIDNGVNQLFHNYFGSGTSAIYSAYVKLESAGNITIVVSDQSTLILIESQRYQHKMQSQEIGNYNTEYSSLYLGCSTTAINTTQTDQQEISETSDRALTINPSSLRQADHSV
ncbi:MAG: hypothetical protein EZS28_049559, partial [Streblomastix strix]